MNMAKYMKAVVFIEIYGFKFQIGCVQNKCLDKTNINKNENLLLDLEAFAIISEA